MIQPKVVASQQLIVVREKHMISIMETNNERIAFSCRLNKLCDDKKLPAYGRQSILRDYFRSIGIKISQESVRKWLTGEGEKRRLVTDRTARTYIVNDPKKQAIIELILAMDEKSVNDVANNKPIRNDDELESKNGTEHHNGTE